MAEQQTLERPLERKIVGSGKYRYEMIPNWGGFPAKLYNNSVAVNSQDRVYVCALGIGDYGNLGPADMIYICDRDGKFLGSWGSGAANHAHGLSIVDDEMYVTDKPDSVCLKYTLDGRVTMIIGSRGAHSDTGCLISGHEVFHAAGPFNHPDDFTRAPWGDLYAADGTHNTRIHRFDSGGHLIQSWGHWGDQPGQFKSPHSVLPTPDRKLYVCDRLNHRVQIFTAEGKFLGQWGGLQWPSEIVITPEGDFAIGEDPGNQTKRKGTDRDASVSARTSGIRILDKEGQFICDLEVGKVHQLAQDSQGNLYVATHVALHKLVRL